MLSGLTGDRLCWGFGRPQRPNTFPEGGVRSTPIPPCPEPSPYIRGVRHGFGADRQSSMLGLRAGPAAQKPLQKVGCEVPPPPGMVFGAAGAAQTPNIDDSRPAQKQCIKNTYRGQSGRGPPSFEIWCVLLRTRRQNRRAQGGPNRVTLGAKSRDIGGQIA